MTTSRRQNSFLLIDTTVIPQALQRPQNAGERRLNFAEGRHRYIAVIYQIRIRYIMEYLIAIFHLTQPAAKSATWADFLSHSLWFSVNLWLGFGLWIGSGLHHAVRPNEQFARIDSEPLEQRL
jgi:hypothetical protein